MSRRSARGQHALCQHALCQHMPGRYSPGQWILTFTVAWLALAAAAVGQTSFSADAGNWESEQRIEEALQRRGSVDFTEEPLRDVVAELSRQFEVQIVVSAKKLEEAGVSLDIPLTKKLDRLTLESILHLLLKDLELDLVVRNEVLLITTPEDAESQLQARVYPVQDLVAVRGEANRDAQGEATDYDSLIEMIHATVHPDTWDDVGGPGSVSALPAAGALAVAQTRAVHREIEGLLTALRHVKAMQGLGPPAANSAGRAGALWRVFPAVAGGGLLDSQAWKLPRVHAADQ